MTKISKFISSFSLRKLLNNKRFTIPFSILLAFVIWLVIVTKENPIIDRSFADMTVNVNLDNTIASENGMSMVGDISSQKFTVIARGPTYLINSLKSENFNVYASAASVDAPGEYDLDVVALPVDANQGYEVLKVVPSTVKVSFDYIDTKEFTVKALAEGVTASQGLIAENSVVSGAESDTITIQGPRTLLNKIDSVVAFANVNKTLSESQTFDATIKLYDKNSKELSMENLTLSATKVKVTVPISKKKTVSVKVAFSNLPEGFDTSTLSYTINTKSVTVIGTPETVDKITNISLSAIDISKVDRQNNSFDVSAELPDGVRLLDNIEHFTVRFNVSNYISRKIDVSKFLFKNLNRDLDASGYKIKNIVVFGPRRAVNNLDTKEVYAAVDLKNKKAGEHTVQVILGFKEDNNIWALGTYDTSVTVKKK